MDGIIRKFHLQPGTISKYSTELRDKILPALGHLKLSQLKPMNLNAFLLRFSETEQEKMVNRKVTANIYAHALKESNRKAVNALESLLEK